MTTIEIRNKLNEINKKIGFGKPKVTIDSYGSTILGINVIKLDEDVSQYLNKSTEKDGLSTYDMCVEAYGQEVADLIRDNINMNNME